MKIYILYCMENYSSLIRLIRGVSESELSDVCISVVTTDAIYPFSFIEYEDEENLGIYYTAEDFSEKFIVINKQYIISVGIVYQQDLIFDNKDSFSIYE